MPESGMVPGRRVSMGAVVGDRELAFALLGTVRCTRDGEPVELGPPQQRAMLAVLLLYGGRAATAAQLVDALWGEEPPARAVAALRTYASRLRALLEPDRSAPAVLVSVTDGYALRIPPDAVDVHRFERLVAEASRAANPDEAESLLDEALTLWHGPALSGVPGHFVEIERTRLSERRLAALEARLELALERGDNTRAAAELSVLVTEHPLRERFHALLMLALYRSGRQADALAVYQRLRADLADELGLDPSPALAGLHQRMLEADPALTIAPAAVPQPGPALPFQLPADIEDFTGRSRQVSHIGTLLHGDGMPVVVLSGPGGVGKTALAVHAAHQVRDRYPDGQLFVDLRGADAQPAAPEAVLVSFLRALDGGEPAASSLDELSALLRSRLAGRRVLVVLDNARDVAQIRPLLPGTAGCAVLVTSRSMLPGLPGARLLPIGPFDTAEALALFARIAGPDRVEAEPAAARSAVAACENLPLAVRILAARLATRPTWSVSTLAGRISDERRRLDELKIGDLAVESTFQLSYSGLGVQAARTFRILAVPESPDLSLSAAAAMLDTDETEAEELCEALVDACLIESPAPARYRYQGLVRLFALRQLQRSERNAVLSRLLAFHLALLSDLLNEPDAANRERLARERGGLFSVVRQAALEPGGTVGLATQLVLALCECVDGDRGLGRGDAAWAMAALMGSLVFVGTPGNVAATPRTEATQATRLTTPLLPTLRTPFPIERLERVDQATQFLDALDTDRTRAWAEFLRGVSALFRQRPDEALQHHLRAVELSTGTGGGMMYAMMIKIYRDSGSFPTGTAIAESCLRAARASGDPATEAFVLHELGLLTSLAGDPAAGVALCAQALELARTVGGEGYAQLRLAQTYLGAGRVGDAVSAARSAVAALAGSIDPSQLAIAHAVLAEALTAHEDVPAARAHYRTAADLFTRLDLPAAAILHNLAD